MLKVVEVNDGWTNTEPLSFMPGINMGVVDKVVLGIASSTENLSSPRKVLTYKPARFGSEQPPWQPANPGSLLGSGSPDAGDPLRRMFL
jgi:hypothetical protein